MCPRNFLPKSKLELKGVSEPWSNIILSNSEGMSNSVEMSKELIRCRNTAEKLYIRQKCSEKCQI